MVETASSPSGAIVHLEVHLGNARPTVYEVGDGGFLIGSVPGCDLRLPGPTTPPVVCLIARHARGASLRKLAPVLPIAVNGRNVSSTYLDNGDRLAIGPIELVVGIEPAEAGSPLADLAERTLELNEREQQLNKDKEELELAKLVWHRRQEEIEAQCQQQQRTLDAQAEQLQSLQRQRPEELSKRQASLDAREQELNRQQAELETLRNEVTRIRHELSQRYQERRNRLLAHQKAIRKAVRKIQKRKSTIEEREEQLAAMAQEASLRAEELGARAELLEREKQLVEEQHRLFASRQQEVQRELHIRLADLEAREAALTLEKTSHEKGQKQHQADLVRLDRIQASIEHRQQQLEQRALEVDRRYEQMQRDTRDLEEQAAQLDDWHNRLKAEAEQLQARKTEQDTLFAQLAERASALEGQQAMLATLRTRLERMREELRQQEIALSDQRALHAATEADIQSRLEEAERIRSDIRNDRQLFDEERRRFDERRQTLDQAVAQLRQTQESLGKEIKDLQYRQEQLDATAAEQEDQGNQLLARGEQLTQFAAKLQAERLEFAERESTFQKAEQSLAALQEQVRRRVEALEARQQHLQEVEEAIAAKQADLVRQQLQAEEAHKQTAAELARLRQELERHTQELEQRRGEIIAQESQLAAEQQRIDEARHSMVGERQELAAEKLAYEVDRQAALEQLRQGREEFLRAREEAHALVRLLPDLELRSTAALDGLVRAREQLREHLNEVHGYARQSREDLDTARRQFQSDFERVRQQELDLQVSRDEHRLAVAAFRQQLSEWQGRIGEMRQTFEVDATQLERRQAEIAERAREVTDTSARLTEEIEQLEQEKREVAERRDVLDRHLTDMQEWYRRKLRDLAGVDAPVGEEPGEGDVVPMPAPEQTEPTGTPDERSPVRAVLTLNDELQPADRQLGERLASLDLVDEDTLHALWAEARRQRRSLRQVLLAGGYLTLYQMALIEAGNLDGLVLGPVRVIDKLPSTPREAIYRVFDPRRNVEALLRHLSESEMHDAVHPDEFKQRFAAAAAVQHSNVAAVLEVFDIANRPAALTEWVNGLPSSDWPGLVSAPGVWYRLVCQAALSLHVVHTAGLCHGHLDSGSFQLTAEGTLKLMGLGEPHWLAQSNRGNDGESPSADLQALGRLVATWATTPPVGKTGKSKPLPDELQAIVLRLSNDKADRQYPSMQTLIEDLDQAGGKVSASTTAWERLLRHVREQTPSTIRQSA
jgi:chromosome segregation ATPase